MMKMMTRKLIMTKRRPPWRLQQLPAPTAKPQPLTRREGAEWEDTGTHLKTRMGGELLNSQKTQVLD